MKNQQKESQNFNDLFITRKLNEVNQFKIRKSCWVYNMNLKEEERVLDFAKQKYK